MIIVMNNLFYVTFMVYLSNWDKIQHLKYKEILMNKKLSTIIFAAVLAVFTFSTLPAYAGAGSSKHVKHAEKTMEKKCKKGCNKPCCKKAAAENMMEKKCKKGCNKPCCKKAAAENMMEKKCKKAETGKCNKKKLKLSHEDNSRYND